MIKVSYGEVSSIEYYLDDNDKDAPSHRKAFAAAGNKGWDVLFSAPRGVAVEWTTAMHDIRQALVDLKVSPIALFVHERNRSGEPCPHVHMIMSNVDFDRKATLKRLRARLSVALTEGQKQAAENLLATAVGEVAGVAGESMTSRRGWSLVARPVAAERGLKRIEGE